jgi:tetratricopeptide (TPR) repeat protein
MMTVDTLAPQKILRLLGDVWADYPVEILVNEIFDLGNALGDLGRFDEEIASYDKAVMIKPDKDEAWVMHLTN